MKKQKGYIVLLSTIFVGAIGTSIALSLLLLGIGNSQTSITLNQGIQARAIANTCAEKALNFFRQDPDYEGNHVLSLWDGSCQILPILGSGDADRTIQVIGSIGNVMTKIEIHIISRTPQITIDSWQEVKDL